MNNEKILLLRKKWSDSLNSQNIAGIMECYDDNAIFKGTMNGRFTANREDIRNYFESMISKKATVRFIGNPKIKQFDKAYIEYGEYEFCVNNQTLYAKYSFTYILNKRPYIISHVSYKNR